MGVFSNFPYTNFHELNLDWLITAMKKLQSNFDRFVDDFESIKVGIPFIHDVAYSYPANSIVIDGNGVAYISKQDVPIGTTLSESDYWISIGAFAYYVEAAETLYIPGRIGAGGDDASHSIVGNILTITESEG